MTPDLVVNLDDIVTKARASRNIDFQLVGSTFRGHCFCVQLVVCSKTCLTLCLTSLGRHLDPFKFALQCALAVVALLVFCDDYKRYVIRRLGMVLRNALTNRNTLPSSPRRAGSRRTPIRILRAQAASAVLAPTPSARWNVDLTYVGAQCQLFPQSDLRIHLQNDIYFAAACYQP